MTQSMVGMQGLCLRLWYRTPAASVKDLVPPGLELVTRGPWAFWQVIVGQVEQWRDAQRSSSTADGNDTGITYRHLRYDLLVQAMTDRADLVRGLYPVRSNADVSPLSAVDTLMLDSRATHASIDLHEKAGQLTVIARGRDGDSGGATIRTGLEAAKRDASSCFPSPAAAAAFFDFPMLRMTIDQASNRLTLTRLEYPDDRGPASPVSIVAARFAFFEALGHNEITLEAAQRLPPGQVCWTTQPPVGVMPGPLQHKALPRRPIPVSSPADAVQAHAEPAMVMR